MAEDVARPSRLGRGLAALIGDVPDEAPGGAASGARNVAVEFLRPNPRNPRRTFPEAELEELAASIRARGLIQPIVTRALANVPGTFEIVAGERRWRAAQRAGLHEVPVVVVEIDDRGSLEFAILENVQRSDLNPIEEAAGYERLMGEFGYTQKELAEVIGKSRSHLANTLRLLTLPTIVQERLAKGEISAGHARSLSTLRDPESVARRIVAEDLSVRDVEAIAAAEAAVDEAPRQGRASGASRRAPGLRIYEHAFARFFGGLGVVVRERPSGAGEIRVRYGSPDELKALCARLDIRPDE